MKTLLKIIAGFFAVLVLLIAAFVAATWAPDKPVAELTPKWAPPPSVFLSIDGMNVHMRDEGPRDDPMPIVLLHGTSASLHTWEGWVDALKGQRRVIRLDLPGFGLTGPFPQDNYTMEHYVDFLGHFLDAMKVQHCVLVGNSFGGNLAWREAVAQPWRVDKLILVDAGGYAYKAQSMPIGFRIAKTPGLNKIMEYTLPRHMVESSVRNVYGDPSKVTPALVDRYYELTLRAGNRHALGLRFAQMVPGEDTDRIAALKMPTLILWGKEDHLIPEDNAEHFHKDIAGSQLQVLDGLGHVPHEEDPARSVAVAKAFLGLK